MIPAFSDCGRCGIELKDGWYVGRYQHTIDHQPSQAKDGNYCLRVLEDAKDARDYANIALIDNSMPIMTGTSKVCD